MKRVIGYYRNAREELAKVIYPAKENIFSAFVSVVSVVQVVMLFLGLVDIILSVFLSSILS